MHVCLISRALVELDMQGSKIRIDTDLATQGGSPRGLRVFLRHNCVNQEGNNVCCVSHFA